MGLFFLKSLIILRVFIYLISIILMQEFSVPKTKNLSFDEISAEQI